MVLILLLLLPALELPAAAAILIRRFRWAGALAVIPVALTLAVMCVSWAKATGYPRPAASLTFIAWHLAAVALLYHLSLPTVDRMRWRILAAGIVVHLFASGSIFTEEFEPFWSGFIGATSVVSLIGPLFTLRVDDRRARILGACLWAIFPLACWVYAAVHASEIL